MTVLSFVNQDGSDVHSTLSNLKLLCHDLPSEITVDVCQCSRGCMKTLKALEFSEGKIKPLEVLGFVPQYLNVGFK